MNRCLPAKHGRFFQSCAGCIVSSEQMCSRTCSSRRRDKHHPGKKIQGASDTQNGNHSIQMDPTNRHPLSRLCTPPPLVVSVPRISIRKNSEAYRASCPNKMSDYMARYTSFLFRNIGKTTAVCLCSNPRTPPRFCPTALQNPWPRLPYTHPNRFSLLSRVSTHHNAQTFL